MLYLAEMTVRIPPDMRQPALADLTSREREIAQRLQREGLIKGEWKATENSRRAKYYLLTEQGRKRLTSETREWGRQVAAIARILEAS